MSYNEHWISFKLLVGKMLFKKKSSVPLYSEDPSVRERISVYWTCCSCAVINQSWTPERQLVLWSVGTENVDAVLLMSV